MSISEEIKERLRAAGEELQKWEQVKSKKTDENLRGVFGRDDKKKAKSNEDNEEDDKDDNPFSAQDYAVNGWDFDFKDNEIISLLDDLDKILPP